MSRPIPICKSSMTSSRRRYNSSISALLKNVIDWGGRPYGQGVWDGTPGAIVGTTPGAIGTAIAQDHLKSILVNQGVALLG